MEEKENPPSVSRFERGRGHVLAALVITLLWWVCRVVAMLDTVIVPRHVLSYSTQVIDVTRRGETVLLSSLEAVVVGVVGRCRRHVVWMKVAVVVSFRLEWHVPCRSLSSYSTQVLCWEST